MSGNWRVVTVAEAERLRAELPSAVSDDGGENLKRVGCLLDKVEESAKKPSSIREWWTGEDELSAWLAVHEAEVELAKMLPDATALAQLPDALATGRREIGNGNNPALQEATSLFFEAYPSGSSMARPPHRRAPQVLSQLLHQSFEAANQRQAQSLSFRNRLLRLIGLSLVSLLLLFGVAAVAGLPWSPVGKTTASSFPAAWLTLLAVIIFGFIGGFISAVPAMARPVASPDPYALAIYQAALKLPLGGLFGVIGCLALQSGTLPGVTGVTSLAGLLFWAAAFGASQQSVSRVIDARIRNLLSPPGEATLPLFPMTASELGAPSVDATSPHSPRRKHTKRSHRLDSVEKTPGGTRQEILAEMESSSE